MCGVSNSELVIPNPSRYPYLEGGRLQVGIPGGINNILNQVQDQHDAVLRKPGSSRCWKNKRFVGSDTEE
jgi:hypothetical protein